MPIASQVGQSQKQLSKDMLFRLQERLAGMSLPELASLHLYLSMYIVGKQQKNKQFIDQAVSWLKRHGLDSILGYSILDIDKVRRLVHKILVEKSKSSAGEYVHVERRAPFKVPDIENLVLSIVDKLGEAYDGVYVTIDRDEISIYWDNSDEEETGYGEPTQIRSISISYIPPFMGGPPKIVVNAEVADRMSELTLDFKDVEELDEQELFQLLEKYPNPEFVGESEDILNRMKEWGETVEILATRNPKVCDMFQRESNAIIFPNGLCVSLLPVENAANEYTKAWLWRGGIDVSVREYEEINKRTGLNLKVDRIYHEYPAELDAGAPGDAIVHASGTLEIPIKRPEDEILATEKIKNIIKEVMQI